MSAPEVQAMRLTVKERILIAISLDQHRLEDGITAPETLCTKGLGVVIGIARAHVSLEAKKLEASGMIRSELRHISGVSSRSRIKCFILTDAGHRQASQLVKALGGKDLALEAVKITTYQRHKSLDEIERHICNLREQVATLELAFKKIKGEAL